MSKNFLIILIIAIIVLVIFGIYYFIFQNFGSAGQVAVEANPTVQRPKIMPTPEQQLAQLVKDYPETITGVISFSDTAKSYNATVKTDEGKSYILLPAQPESVYAAALGVKNGQRVEILGKFTGQGNLEWGTMKPI